MERHHHTNGEATLHRQIHTDDQHGGVCQRRYEGRNHTEILIELGKLDLLCVHACLIACPFLKKAVFRTACLNGFDHFDACHGRACEFTRVTHRNTGDVHTLFRDNTGHKHIDEYRCDSNKCQKEAVSDHNHKVEHHHARLNHKRCKGMHKCGSNRCVRALALLNVACHSLRKEFHRHTKHLPHKGGATNGIDLCADTRFKYRLNEGDNNLYRRKCGQRPNKRHKPFWVLSCEQSVDENS